jgi:hypothetical protein
MPALLPCLQAVYRVPSSDPTMKLFTSFCGKERHVVATA